MMRRPSIVLGLLAAAAFGAAAQAADMPRFPPEFEQPPEAVVEYTSGWYLRGDLGYRNNKIGGIDAPVVASVSHIDNIVSAGGGFGYKYQWLRADLTFDYAMRGRVSAGTEAFPKFYDGKIDGFTGLANVYFDLGNWGGFTPYIGAGAGFSRMNLNEFTAMAPAVTPQPSETWRFSYAFTAGVSYQFTSNWAIDVGYRHLTIGDAVSSVDTAGNRIAFKDLTAQEVRVGFRLTIE